LIGKFVWLTTLIKRFW